MDGYWVDIEGGSLEITYLSDHVLPKEVVVDPTDGSEPVRYVPERTARMEVCHGHHGSEPHYPGDRWTQYYVCCACRRPVSPGDAWCSHCGARFEGVAGDGK